MKERKKEEIFARHGGRFPYSCVLHWSQMPPLGATTALVQQLSLPQENPLEWGMIIFVIFVK